MVYAPYMVGRASEISMTFNHSIIFTLDIE